MQIDRMADTVKYGVYHTPSSFCPELIMCSTPWIQQTVWRVLQNWRWTLFSVSKAVVELERKKLLQARLMAIKLADAKIDLHKSLPAPLAVLDGKRLLFWKGLLPGSRSATNSSLSVSMLHCQDCQRGRPMTGGLYMLRSLLADRIVPVSLFLKKQKRAKRQ